MLARVLFLLLLFLNLGVGCWLYFSPTPQKNDTHSLDPTAPTLMLLSEREHAEGSVVAELASSPEPSRENHSNRCFSIGPFSTQADMRKALTSLTPLVKHIQSRETREIQPRGFWVYLPPQPTREQALRVARELSGKGVRDYYVVAAGDRQNTISLGLFKDQTNAEKRRVTIAELGFEPQLIARTEELPVYWLDIAQKPQNSLDWRSEVPRSVNLKEQSIACF